MIKNGDAVSKSRLRLFGGGVIPDFDWVYKVSGIATERKIAWSKAIMALSGRLSLKQDEGTHTGPVLWKKIPCNGVAGRYLFPSCPG